MHSALLPVAPTGGHKGSSDIRDLTGMEPTLVALSPETENYKLGVHKTIGEGLHSYNWRERGLEALTSV